jgi:ABC-type Na+ efflux pump permease subunit
MKYSDLISGIFWLIVGLLLSIWSLRYRIGSIINPGPGFLPLGLGLLLIFFSLILLWQAKKSFLVKEKGTSASFPGIWKKAYTILILLLATFFFEIIGYLLTIFLFIFSLMLGQDLKNWKKIFFIALFTAVGVYIIFVLILRQPLPQGFLRI